MKMTCKIKEDLLVFSLSSGNIGVKKHLLLFQDQFSYGSRQH